MTFTTKDLTVRRLRQWAGGRSFERGEAYFEEGRVSNLKEYKGKITASVMGAHQYRVKLWEDDDGVDYDCSCPVGRDGGFCKHCVATALAWREEYPAAGGKQGAKRKQPKKTSSGVTMKDVHGWLLTQRKEMLADMLVEAAIDDELLGNRLMLKAAAAKGVNLVTYKKVIDQAIVTGDFIDY